MSMARHADPQSAQVAANLADADKLEGMTGTAATAEHAAPQRPIPTALGLDATAWVSLAMIVVIALMLWKKVPAVIGRALDKKIAGIRAQLDEASRLRAEAEALKAEYQAQVGGCRGRGRGDRRACARGGRDDRRAGATPTRRR